MRMSLDEAMRLLPPKMRDQVMRQLGEVVDLPAPETKKKIDGKKGTKLGKRADLGGIFFRSAMEANFARILQWQKQRRMIADWKYECEEFSFPVNRGNRFYKPDFTVWLNSGRCIRYECKGWMDASSRVKLERMRRYHPNIELRLIDDEVYQELKRLYKPMIKLWE